MTKKSALLAVLLVLHGLGGAALAAEKKADIPALPLPATPVVQTVKTAGPAVRTQAVKPAAGAAAVNAAAAAPAAAASVQALPSVNGSLDYSGQLIQRRLTTDELQRAVDAGLPAGQEDALRTIYEGIGPRKGTLEVVREGPIFRMRYYGQADHAKIDLKGRKPVFVLVGSGNKFGRGWYGQMVRESVKRVSEDPKNGMPGMELLVIDEPDAPLEGAEHFLPAAVNDGSPENRRDVVARLMKYADEHNLMIMGVTPSVQTYIKFTASIQQEVAKSHNPAIRVNTEEGMEATTDKFATRMLLNDNSPRHYWPAESPGDVIKDGDIKERALASYARLSKATPSGQLAAKLNQGAGKGGLFKGEHGKIAAIDSPEKMGQGVDAIRAELLEYWTKNQHRAQLYTLTNQLLLEGMMDALAEVDVELGMSVLHNGVMDVMGTVILNPNPGSMEKGYGFGLNGFFSETLQRNLVAYMFESMLYIAEKAPEKVGALKTKYGMLPTGNAHTEAILRGDKSNPDASVVELNWRAIGGNGVRYMKEWSGVDLPDVGVRSALGLPLQLPEQQPKDAMLVLAVMPQETGTISKLAIPADKTLTYAELAKPNQITTQKQGPFMVPAKKAGDNVLGQETPQPDYLGVTIARAGNMMDAAKAQMAFMDGVKIDIETPKGKVEQTAGAYQGIEDYVPLPQLAPSPRAGEGKLQQAWSLLKKVVKSSAAKPVPPKNLSPEAKAILDRYEKSQLIWTPIFTVYGPLFTAFMFAVGGLVAVGVGRAGYTLGIFLSSPVASVLSGRMSVRSLFRMAWGTRVAIWTLAIPAAVLLFPPATAGAALASALFAINLVDGLMVSFSHPVDIDAFGLDTVAKQYGFSSEMTPEVRKYYTAKYFAWLSKAQFIFPTGIGAFIVGASVLGLSIPWAFMGGMILTFAGMGGAAIYQLLKMPAGAKVTPKQGVWDEFKKGMLETFGSARIRNMVTLDALERTLIDVLRMVSIPFFALLTVGPALGVNDAVANFIGTVLLSISSYGGMLASRATGQLWQAPKDKDAAEWPAYKKFYPMMFAAGAMLLTVPAAYALVSAGFVYAGLGVAAVGAFLFNLPFKPAQIGAINLLQKITDGNPYQTQISGVSAMLQMVVNGAVIFGLSWLFDLAKAGTITLGGAFMGTALFGIAVGAAYWLIGRTIPSRVPGAKA